MEIPKNYLEINKASWNQKTAVHVTSDFYDMERFLNGKSTLKDIELSILGDVSGKKILHLQCHFGQDTISLARLGASTTGVDLSDKAIEKATELAVQLNADAKFICSDVYDLPNYLHEKFDIVFTSYGTIGWLPDLDKWAKVISHFLKPDGKFVFAEFHPVVWMFDYDFKKVQYSYFNIETILETEEGTYADKNAPIKNQTASWNHSLSEVFSALLNNGMAIETFEEFDYSPYNCFNNTEEFEPNKFRIQHLENKIPMVYSLTAIKK
ncbi:class I SAM-dependent methyltransferase [Flavobacterium sp. SM15]|uniref:class I SAM-dependent methyltransferase n=1 Tax=Flavobacterium sp. SM15 TaxID=2908005 RepID=UPI001EDC1953|nr:class I SAM-dependent methyltransferase [Flavobacterium sp. SM15]MCG2611755.1 class I SAM-dependent methyltransferase [Flavobacterium sp. SM15]